jgi:hypothetical protein
MRIEREYAVAAGYKGGARNNKDQERLSAARLCVCVICCHILGLCRKDSFGDSSGASSGITGFLGLINRAAKFNNPNQNNALTITLGMLKD